MLMEKLSSGERAAYVLREAFEYPYRQIADVLATSEANARQLVTRARLHLAGEPRRQVSAAEQQLFIDAFVNAAQTGDLTTLEQLLAAHGRPVPTLGARLGSPTDARGALVGDLRRRQQQEGTS
jgi:RNA polymerase sigma-70 factor (ECF subfamily)